MKALAVSGLIATALIATALTAAALSPWSASVASADACYNGVFPLNPYVNNCAITPRPPRVLGSAPDQTAILNCSIGSAAWRAQCLSLYVNGGYGWYPGAVLAPGYHP